MVLVVLLAVGGGMEDLARRFCCSCRARREVEVVEVVELPIPVEGNSRSIIDLSSSTLNNGILALICAAAASLWEFHKLPPSLLRPDAIKCGPKVEVNNATADVDILKMRRVQ